MIFLVVYDRGSSFLRSIESFEDSDRSKAYKLKMETELSLLGSGDVVEVILLEASSEEQLRSTHRRYFETLNDLKDVGSVRNERKG